MTEVYQFKAALNEHSYQSETFIVTRIDNVTINKHKRVLKWILFY